MQRQSLCGFNKDLNDQISFDPCIISQFSDQWISVVLTAFPFICQFFARQWFSSSYCQCNPLSVVNQSVRSSNYFQVSRVTVTHIICLEMKTESLCCSHFCNGLHILHKHKMIFYILYVHRCSVKSQSNSGKPQESCLSPHRHQRMKGHWWLLRSLAKILYQKRSFLTKSGTNHI